MSKKNKNKVEDGEAKNLAAQVEQDDVSLPVEPKTEENFLQIDLGEPEIPPYTEFSAEEPSLPLDYQPEAVASDEFVVMPAIVQPIEVVPDEPVVKRPQTVEEVFEVIAPSHTAGAARVGGFLSFIFSLFSALPFVLSIAGAKIEILEDFIQAPNIASQLKVALASSTATMADKIAPIMLALGLFLICVNMILGLAALMSGTRIRYSYIGLFVMLMLVGSQFIDQGFADLGTAASNITYITVTGIGLFHCIAEVLATACSPKKRDAKKKKEKKEKRAVKTEVKKEKKTTKKAEKAAAYADDED